MSITVINGINLSGSGPGSDPIFNSVSLTNTTNQIILGSAPNQTTINSPAPSGNITLTLPILTGTLIQSTVGLNPSTIVGTDTTSNLISMPLTNGQLLIGSTSAAPVAKTLTGTTNEVVVTNTAGTITLSTPQPIGTTSQVQFPNIYCGSSTATFDCPLQFDSTTSNRKITLFETANNQFQFYGFGIAAGTLIYNVGVNTSNHVFSSAFSSTALTTLFTIFGNQAGVSIPATTR